ncbi:sensor domain-containing protein [Aeromicrobium sp. NPDC092404]|uniref:sensor histidine kinase n=1 Tax=Aeromicrobium sp. NPDC092404 TaxID=3154976 RepID=UPI003426A153
MATTQSSLGTSLRAAVDTAWRAVRQLVGGAGTGLLALVVAIAMLAAAILGVVGVGLLLVPLVLRALHALADRERVRLDRWEPGLVRLEAGPVRLREAVADPLTRREARWLVGHATFGVLLGVVGALLPLLAFRDLILPAYWWLVPGEATASLWFWIVDSWAEAAAVFVLGLGWTAATVWLTPTLALLQTQRGRRLLAPGDETDLPLRVAQLTATRAAALDAHAAELRRIERALHDSTQNPLVAVTVLIGAARRAITRDPAGADELLEQAQTAAERALTELRGISRVILPPVLADRGLAGALSGLAATSAVPCQVDVDVPQRCAASVEATAYFVVSEALTNISRHSGAAHAQVTVRTHGPRLRVRVFDDGVGGAGESSGSGISGMRRRVEAHDGSLALTSPQGGPTVLEVELPCGS